MSLYQRQLGDCVDLTPEGLELIKAHPNMLHEQTAQIPSSKRDWKFINIFNLWVGMIVSIAVYQVTSGLIVSGMTWYQALFTIVLGHTLVMIFAIVFGHFGTKYGLNYPMLSRIVFGTKGVIIPSIVRGLLGCFWFGVQTWIGGQALNAIIGALFPAWYNLGFTGTFIAFIIFWCINVLIAAAGGKGVKLLEDIAAPVLVVLSFIVIAWGLNLVGWNISALLSVPVLQAKADANFWHIFWPALSSMIAFDGTIALSMADFTRYSQDQKGQSLGQIISAPIMTFFIAFVGICGTAGAFVAFGKEIWEPSIIVAQFSNPFIVILFSIFIIGAVLTTNVAANLVPPTNIIASLSRSKISYKWAAVIAAVLALLAQPWNALSSAYTLVYTVCGALGALLGPISGIYFVAYLFEHRTKFFLPDVFRTDKDSRYFYKAGWNIEACISFFVTLAVVYGGLFIPQLRFMYDNSFVLGAILSALVYLAAIVVSGRAKSFAKQSAQDELE